MPSHQERMICFMRSGQTSVTLSRRLDSDHVETSIINHNPYVLETAHALGSFLVLLGTCI